MNCSSRVSLRDTPGGLAVGERILAGMRTCAALLGLLALAALTPEAGADPGAWIAAPAGAGSGVPIESRSTAMDSRTAAEVSDAAARMQYAYYTADAQALNGALKQVEAVDESWDGLRDYQLAYGYWKLAQMYTSGPPARPGSGEPVQAARVCVRHARLAREAASQWRKTLGTGISGAETLRAEASAIAAACGALATGVAACARSRTLREALAAAPGNPRVRLIEAGCLSSRDTPGSAAALERWRVVVARFEAAPPPHPGQPDWGYVEALTYFGETSLQRGEFVAARDALERALVLVPDHRAAQSLLRAARPRVEPAAPVPLE